MFFNSHRISILINTPIKLIAYYLNKTIRPFFSIILLVSVSFSAQSQLTITKIREDQITNNAHPQSVTKTINLRGHQDPAITSFNGYQYAVFYSVLSNNLVNRYVNIARRKLPNGDWEVIRFTDYVQKLNDAHNVIVVGICEGDGTIHLAFDHHNSTLKYKVSVQGLATSPENHSWTSNKFGGVLNALPGTTPNTAANKQWTYPRFIRVPNGNLQILRRHGSAISGASHLYTYDQSSHNWKHHGEIINGRAVFYTNNAGKSTKLGPYINGINYHGNRLHVSWIWRTEGTTSNQNFDMMYAYSDDYGITWKNNTGVKAGTAGSDPMTYKNSPAVKVFNFPEGHGLTNQTDQTVDNQGRVHVYQTRNISGGGRRFNHLYRDINGDWIKNETNRSSQRGKITHDESGNVYAILSSGTIEGATVASGYNDWSRLRSDNTFAGEAQFDKQRMTTDGIISMLVAKPGTSKEIFSLDLQTPSNGGLVNTPPTGSFLAPIFSSIKEGYSELYVRIDAEDIDGDSVDVTLKINGENIRTEKSGPFEWGHTTNSQDFTFETKNLLPGTHVFEAFIIDERGASTTISKTITVTEKGITILPPIHDAYIQGLNGFNNTDLKVESGNRVTYLQFDISNDSFISEATLELTVGSDAGSGLITVREGIHSNWAEQTISDNNAPSSNTLLDEKNQIFNVGQTYSFDVSSANFNQQKITFVLQMPEGGDDVWFGSKESEDVVNPRLKLKESTITSFSESQKAKPVLYPNPVQDQTIIVNFKLGAHWKLTNEMGVKTLTGTNQYVNTQNLNKGIYFLELSTGEVIRLLK